MLVSLLLLFFFFLMIRRPPRSTLFPTRRSSDLNKEAAARRQKRERHCRQNHSGPRERNFAKRFDQPADETDRKSTRLNSSHSQISYAVFCLKKKKARFQRRKANTIHVSPVTLFH